MSRRRSGGLGKTVGSVRAAELGPIGLELGLEDEAAGRRWEELG